MQGNRQQRQRMVILLAPLVLVFCFSNCHPGGNFETASNRKPASRTQADQDSQPVSTFTEEQPSSKMALDPAKLSRLTITDAQGKATVQSDELAIPSGLRMMVLVDNACVAKRQQARVQGQLKATAPALAEKAISVSGQSRVQGLKLQAYSFENPSEVSYDEIASEAELDECVLRIANNERIQLIPRKPVATTQSLNADPKSGTAKLQMSINDPSGEYLTHLPAIKAYSAWDVFYSPSRGIRRDILVAIIDSGVDATHPDLAANMWRDANGNYGMDFQNNDGHPADDNGHGTHVAGLMGAIANNNVGVAGVMNRHIKMAVAKITDAEGAGEPRTIANGVRWAADIGADVINMSLGFQGLSTEIRDAVSYAASKGCVVVVAAGNEGFLLSTTQIVTPASQSIQIPGALTVGSTDSGTGERSAFSNYSNTYVQISAPGSHASSVANERGLWSTWPGNRYALLEGTSMATPIVSGAAALTIGLLKSESIAYTNAQVVSLLTSTAEKKVNLANVFASGNALDLDRLSRVMRARYLIESDAGTEAP